MREDEMIYGLRAVIEAVKAGREIDRIWIGRNLQSGLIRELHELLHGSDIPVQRVPVERLDRLTQKNHQGVVALISAITYHRVDQIIPHLYEQGRLPFLVLLDGITDVRNFGAIARTCECAGVDALVIPQRESVSVNGDAMKTSSGALNVLPVCREPSIRRTIRYLKESGVTVIAACEKATRNYTEIPDYVNPVALVMGSEERGVDLENLRACDEMVKIPRFGVINSLNVSVATAILVYECVRRRMETGTPSSI